MLLHNIRIHKMLVPTFPHNNVPFCFAVSQRYHPVKAFPAASSCLSESNCATLSLALYSWHCQIHVGPRSCRPSLQNLFTCKCFSSSLYDGRRLTSLSCLPPTPCTLYRNYSRGITVVSDIFVFFSCRIFSKPGSQTYVKGFLFCCCPFLPPNPTGLTPRTPAVFRFSRACRF